MISFINKQSNIDCNFNFAIEELESGNLLKMEDLSAEHGGASLTNSIGWVLPMLKEKLKKEFSEIRYIDSDGAWTGYNEKTKSYYHISN